MKSGQKSYSRKIEVTSGETHLLEEIVSGAFFDTNNNFVSGIAYRRDGARCIVAPINAKYIGANYSNQTTANVRLAEEIEIIGTSTITGNLS